MKLLDFLDQHSERLLAIIRAFRPKLYNTLTWAVVTTGLALVGTNLIDDVLVELINKHFGFHIDLSNVSLIGLCLVGIGLLYHLCARYLFEVLQDRTDSAKLSSITAHDAEVFRRFQEQVDPQQIMDLFYDLEDDAVEEPYKSTLSRLVHFRYLPDNHFLDTSTEKAAIQMTDDMTKLLDFIGHHFFFHPDDQTDRRALYPDHNIDRGGKFSIESSKRYGEYSCQLSALCRTAQESYESFRKQIKKAIKV